MIILRLCSPLSPTPPPPHPLLCASHYLPLMCEPTRNWSLPDSVVFRVQSLFQWCQYFDNSLAFKICQIINWPIEIGNKVNKHDSRVLVPSRVLVSFFLCFRSMSGLFALKLRVQSPLLAMGIQTPMFQFRIITNAFMSIGKYKSTRSNFISLVECLYTTRGPQDPAPIHHTEWQTCCIIISSFRSYLASVLKKSKVKLNWISQSGFFRSNVYKRINNL